MDGDPDTTLDWGFLRKGAGTTPEEMIIGVLPTLERVEDRDLGEAVVPHTERHAVSAPWSQREGEPPCRLAVLLRAH